MANLDKESSRQAVEQAAALIAQSGRKIVCDLSTSAMVVGEKLIVDTPAALARAVDLVLVFGGDGTMLRISHDIEGSRTPLLGINAGRLGFLTAVPINNLAAALEKIWQNEYTLECRPLMEARGTCGGKPVFTHALNDIVISHGSVSRMIELEVSINGDFLTCYRGDGLIVCSPTGSTAYSLSAGGPIISPEADVLAITPICAHALSNRTVVVGSTSRVQVKLISPKVETIVSADGEVQQSMNPGDALIIHRSRRVVNLLHPGGSSFFETVRRKLHWRGSYL